MDLKAAVDVLAKFVDEKSADKNYDVVCIGPGHVYGMSAIMGCVIETGITIKDMAVPCSKLRDALKQVGREPTVTVEKGRKLQVQAKNRRASYLLKSITKKKIRAHPEPPDTGWKHVTDAEIRALRAIAEEAGKQQEENAYAIHGCRLTPDWLAAGTSNSLNVAFLSWNVDFTVTILPRVLVGLSGDADVAYDGARFWIRTEDQLRWCQSVITPWPDAMVDRLVEQYEEVTIAAKVPIHDLLKLANAAASLTKSHRGFTMKVEPSKLTLSGTEENDRHAFSGFVLLHPGPKGKAGTTSVGVVPKTMAQAATVMGQVTAKAHYLAMAGGPTPVFLISEGEITVFCAFMPVVIDGA